MTLILITMKLLNLKNPSEMREHGIVVYKKIVKLNIFNCGVPNVLVIFLFYYNMCVINVYRPSSNTSDVIHAILNYLSSFCGSREFLLQQGFNT